MTEAFYVPDGDRYRATELTRGPWDPGAQHAGPPAALLGRALARCPGATGDVDGWQLGRVTFELLRPVPIAELEASARDVRPGRSVELLEASLTAGGEEVMRATGWRLRTGALELPLA